MREKRNVLFIFNLETNLESSVLALGHSWIESLAKNNFEKIFVYSTHVGRHNLPKNVKVFELGGGNIPRRLLAVLRLIKSTGTISRYSSRAIAFHHMSVRTTLYPGIFIKLLRIPQGIWYSHSSLPVSLRLATKIADFVFTSVPGSTSINSNKLRYIGHGIDFTNYPDVDEVLKIQKEGIVSLGRIAPIKNLEKIVQAGENEVGFPGITFIGPNESATTLTKELEILALKNRVSLSFIPAIPHEYVPDYLSKYSIYYSGTPKSVDKSTLEAASVGCLVVTSEVPARELTGMNNVWTNLGHDLEIDIKDQIKVIGSVSAHELLAIRRYVMEFTRAANDVVNTTKKIVEQLRELR